MSKTINVSDEGIMRKVIQYLSENKDIELKLDEDDYGDIEAIRGILEGSLECIAEILGKEKSENENVSIEIPGYISFSVSYREGTGEADGNWGVGAVVGAEIKKRIKDDESLED